jgi:Condensation domain
MADQYGPRADPAAAAGYSGPAAFDWQAEGDSIVLPQSYEQEWFYLRYMMHPRETFPIWLGYDIDGPLDIGAFGQAIDDVIARQHAMRAVFFADENGQLHQRINRLGKEHGINCQRVICESRRQFDVYTRALAKNDGRMLWDLERVPAYRFHLLQYSERVHFFLVTLHHLAFDLTSVQILERELWTCYAHRAYGREAAPAAADLISTIRRQRSRYDHRVNGANAEYWRRQTAIAPPVWQRAATTGMPSGKPMDRASISIEYDGEFAERLRAACTRIGCSAYELSLCIFASVAFQLSYQERLAVYVIFDSRNADESDVIGMFSGAHPVVLRRPDGSAGSFLRHVRRESLRFLVHRHVGADQAVSARMRQWSRWQMQPRRALSINYITIGGRDPRRLMPADLRIDRRSRRSLDALIGAGPDSMHLIVREFDDKFEAFLEYNPHSLSAELVREILAAFGQSLTATVDSGDLVLASLTGQHAAAHRPVPGELTPLLDADGLTCLHVDCSEVRSILLDHPRVEAADVRVEEHRDGGSEVVAYLRASADVDAAELRRLCAQWPSASAFALVPGRIHVSGPASDAQQAAGDTPAAPEGGQAWQALAGTGRDQEAAALLALMIGVLPGAGPTSEFWTAGGSFAAIFEMAKLAREARLPEPSAADFATPCTLAAAAAAIVMRAAEASGAAPGEHPAAGDRVHG